jgi:exopolysaccharide biosynthesis predicted pyruvyltransferase EpsI
LRKKIINIINSAKFVSFRDQETANYFKKYGVDREIYVTTDTALSINTLKIPSLDCNFESLMREKKNIFFHVYGSDKTNYELAEKLLPALNHFLLEHPNEYRVFVGTDNLCRKKIQELDIYKSLCADKIPVNYSSTWAMCSLLKSMNTVLTVKLHVGIVSSLYGKSVISIPKHVTKTKRFYKQIGASDRSTLLKEATADEVYRKLCQYADMPIQVPVELQEKAWLNIPQI